MTLDSRVADHTHEEQVAFGLGTPDPLGKVGVERRLRAIRIASLAPGHPFPEHAGRDAHRLSCDLEGGTRRHPLTDPDRQVLGQSRPASSRHGTSLSLPFPWPGGCQRQAPQRTYGCSPRATGMG